MWREGKGLLGARTAEGAGEWLWQISAFHGSREGGFAGGSRRQDPGLLLSFQEGGVWERQSGKETLKYKSRGEQRGVGTRPRPLSV